MQSVEAVLPERSLDDPALSPVRDALQLIHVKTVLVEAKLVVQKKHNHLPPKEIGKIRQGLTHRFDMGEGWY